MKFGAVPEHLLHNLDLRLPEEPAFNKDVLPGKRGAPRLYVGAATWGEGTWPGKLYLPQTPTAKFRQQYPEHFNTIELNATHYNIYSPQVIRSWAASAKGKEFKFCPKFPQAISHHSGFVNTDDVTAAFLESISAFEENLGPAFLQLSEYFSPVNKGVLFEYLASLPADKTFFLEVRHPQWFTPKESEELFAILKALNIGAVITDAPGRRDGVHMHLTMPKLLLRFVCNALHPTSLYRTAAWVQRLAYWVDRGLEEAYVFLHPGNDSAVPELATYWIEHLNAACAVQLKPPTAKQQRLF
jgi:uncharacterized protein YecE (DUF72 family)